MAGRMTERRILRRAADDALMTPRRVPDDADQNDSRLDDDRDFPPGFAGRRGNPDIAARADISATAGGYRHPPRHQSKWLLAAAAIAVIVVLAVWGIIGVLRSPGSGGDGSPALSPPTAQSVPTSAPVEGRSGEPILDGTPPAATAESVRPR